MNSTSDDTSYHVWSNLNPADSSEGLVDSLQSSPQHRVISLHLKLSISNEPINPANNISQATDISD